MLWNDLREFLSRLDQLGELRRVTGANWEEEIGAISELMLGAGGPAILFDEIVGYPKGYRVASNVTRAPRRAAIAFGLDHEHPAQSLSTLRDELLTRSKPIPREEAAWGPVFENVLTGDQIDLFKFPTPKWHELDGGRYIGTGVCVINKDPDSDYVNAGSYRVCIQDARTCGLFIEPDGQGDAIRQMYWKQGKKCPVAISVGQEPILTELAGSVIYRSPWGVSEFDVAGYLHKSPYPVVKGQFTGLPFPASAEIVIEGFIPSPDERLLAEGPFGEWTGYYAHERRPETVVEVEAIYHRNDPILYGARPTRQIRPLRESGTSGGPLRRQLEKAGVSGVQGIFNMARPNFRVVAIRQEYEGHVGDIVKVLEPGGDQFDGNHIWVLVDDDIDITDAHEVIWAIATRCIPENGIKVIPGTAVWQLDPRVPPGYRSNPDLEGRQPYSAYNLVIDACRPFSWFDEFPPVNACSPELKRRTREKWGHLFAPVNAQGGSGD